MREREVRRSRPLDGVITQIGEFREALWRSSPDSPLRQLLEKRVEDNRRRLARMLTRGA